MVQMRSNIQERIAASHAVEVVLDSVLATNEHEPPASTELVVVGKAYGNSVMPRNDDSSRFGKLYKLHFHPATQAAVW